EADLPQDGRVRTFRPQCRQRLLPLGEDRSCRKARVTAENDRARRSLHSMLKNDRESRDASNHSTSHCAARPARRQAMAKKDTSDIKDPKLAGPGKKRVDWAGRDMPVLALIAERFRKEKPLKGAKMTACLHVTAETANLMRTLKAGGADIALC